MHLASRSWKGSPVGLSSCYWLPSSWGLNIEVRLMPAICMLKFKEPQNSKNPLNWLHLHFHLKLFGERNFHFKILFNFSSFFQVRVFLHFFLCCLYLVGCWARSKELPVALALRQCEHLLELINPPGRERLAEVQGNKLGNINTDWDMSGQLWNMQRDF